MIWQRSEHGDEGRQESMITLITQEPWMRVKREVLSTAGERN